MLFKNTLYESIFLIQLVYKEISLYNFVEHK